MLGFLALCLSVWCRRVLFANVILIGFVLALFIGHVAAAAQIGIVFHYYLAILLETRPWYAALFADRPWEAQSFPWTRAFFLALGQQTAFLLTASTCGLLAFWRFQRWDYAFS